MRFVGTGVSHKTAPIGLREKLAQQTSTLEETLKEIRKSSTIKEVCVVSTCNRVEFYVSGPAEPAALARDVRSFILSISGASPQELEPCLYEHTGTEGLRHLFRVASSLDSMVLGEPQILGQVKEAWATAEKVGSTGPVLTRIFQRAFSVAKRVRTETGISENAVSMSFAAVEKGREIFTSLAGKNVLIIGAGKMSTLAARHLKNQGIAEIRVANRSIERASQLAAEIGGSASNLDDLELLLQRADIVISSTAAPGYVVTKALMAKVLRQRRYRPILFIDLAVPRDIDPAVADLENAFVYDVDDLEQVVEGNQKAREKEAKAAEAIIEGEIDAFLKWSQSQEVVPVIKALREKGLAIADGEVERALGALHLTDPKQEKAVRAMAQAIMNKLLHPVLSGIKDDGPGRAELAGAVVKLFQLTPSVEEARADAESLGEPAPATAEVVSIDRNKRGGG
ncbi:MAG: glutamyl-tRNA reductase [Myxococcota bacterium]